MSVTRPQGMHHRVLARLTNASFRLVLGFGGLAVVAGCGPQARGGGTFTPGGNGAVSEGPDPQGREEGNNIGDLKARLQRLQVKHSQMSTASTDASFNVCEELCSLASSTCTVKEKLCDIADEHPGEDEFQNLCRKAELQCGEAEDSCVTCVEAREREAEQADPAEEAPHSGGD